MAPCALAPLAAQQRVQDSSFFITQLGDALLERKDTLNKSIKKTPFWRQGLKFLKETMGFQPLDLCVSYFHLSIQLLNMATLDYHVFACGWLLVPSFFFAKKQQLDSGFLFVLNFAEPFRTACWNSLGMLSICLLEFPWSTRQSPSPKVISPSQTPPDHQGPKVIFMLL